MQPDAGARQRRRSSRKAPSKRDKPAARLKAGDLDWNVIGSDPEGARMIYMRMMTSFVLREQVQLFSGTEGPINEAAGTFFRDFETRMTPRDAVEEMLLAQMAWTHARLAYLSTISTKQQSVKWFQLVHEAADAASNTFRRQMLALAEYRRPPRASFTAIAQANIAQQQVVQNRNPELANPTNEQGSLGEAHHGAKALPAHDSGVGGVEEVRSARAAVAAEHRSAHRAGEGAVADERMGSRRAVARGRGAAAGVDGADADAPA